MAFTKGTSGNPQGRPAKPRAPGEAKLRADLLIQAPAILMALEERAKDGDVGAARVLLDRCLAPLRATEPPTPVPLGGLAEASRRILEGIEQGTLNPDQAAKLAATVASLSRSIESLEFESRLSTLETAANAAQP